MGWFTFWWPVFFGTPPDMSRVMHHRAEWHYHHPIELSSWPVGHDHEWFISQKLGNLLWPLRQCPSPNEMQWDTRQDLPVSDLKTCWKWLGESCGKGMTWCRFMPYSHDEAASCEFSNTLCPFLPFPGWPNYRQTNKSVRFLRHLRSVNICNSESILHASRVRYCSSESSFRMHVGDKCNDAGSIW